jgi:DNA-binding MarR family transcriptional regulator
MSGSRRLATSHRDADDSPGLVLWQVTNRWQAAQRAALRPFDLTHVQFVLLASLTWLATEGPVTQRKLAEHAATDPMMTSQVLRSLESRDLVRRPLDASDRRARAVEVTEAGAQLANRANAAVEKCDRAFFAPTGARIEQFTAILRALRDGPRDPETSKRH